MLQITIAAPSPLTQALVYLTGILLGHALLTPTEELQRAWRRVRTAWSRRRS